MSANELKHRGNKAFDAGDYDTAIDLYTQAISLDPEDHFLFSSRSAAYAAQTQWADALADAKQCVARNPSWWEGYARRGKALHGSQRYAEAIAAYEAGLGLEDNPALRNGLKEVHDAKAIADGKMLSDPQFFRKLASNPRTQKHLSDPDFIQKASNPHALLHEAALRADEEAVALCRKLAETDPTATKDLAQLLHNFGVDLCALGCHEDAMRADEEAVALRRKLVVTDPTVTKDLAYSLHNFGSDLSSLGHHEDALRADKEAVALRRKLAETDPTFTKGLANSLHNLGFDLRQLGRLEDALCADEEAVALCRKLVETDQALTKDLARSLHSFGIDLGELGYHEDALCTNEESVELHRKLAETDPTVNKDLAWSLHNFGSDLSSLGHHEDALSADEEAIALRRKLAETDPTVTKGLAHSLHNLGFDLRQLGRLEDALRADEEAVALCRKLVETDQALTKDLAHSLHSFGLDLFSLVHYKDAVRANEEAVALRRKLAETDPTVTKDLAWSLHNLGCNLRQLGQHEDALRANEEAAELRRKLAGTDPTVGKDLADSLSNLGFDLYQLGQHEDALRADEEAVEIHRKLVETDPTATKDLARSLHDLSINLRYLGRHEDSLRADEEAAGIRRKITEADPTDIVSLAASLENIGLNLNAIGRHHDAVCAGEEAARLFEGLPDRTAHLDLLLANTQKLLAAHLRTVNRHEDASRADEEGTEMLRKLAETNLDCTARSFHILAVDFRSIGLHNDAFQAEEQAVALYRKGPQTKSILIHRQRIEALESLAGILRDLGREDDAEHTDLEVATLSGSSIQILGPNANTMLLHAPAHEVGLQRENGTSTGLGSEDTGAGMLNENENNPTKTVKTGTLVIYSPDDDRPDTPAESFTTNDLTYIQASLGIGDCSISICEPVDAASWIEDNWDGHLLTSIRNGGCGGPFAWMLSPTKPALAIFGSYNEPVVINMAQTLAGTSRFPVVIRPASDNPAFTLLTRDHNLDGAESNGRDLNTAEQHEQNLGNGYTGAQGSTVSGGGSDSSGRLNEGVVGRTGDGDGRDAEGGDDRGGGAPRSNRSGGGGGRLDGGAQVKTGSGGGAGDDGGGEPTTVDGNWEGPLHRTRVELRLNLSTGHAYAVNIGYTFKFTINAETEIPIDLKDLTRPLSQPEVLALVDLKIETRPRETQVDRSYATLGFVAHRRESIIEREFLHRGFDLPDRLYKHGQHRQIQRGFKATLGFSQGSPLGTTAFSYNQNDEGTLEASDSKVMPRCRVDYEIGDKWDKDNKSYSSYNICYRAQDVRLDAERPKLHPLEVKAGMGINLQPPSYLDNIRTEEELAIYEKEDINLGKDPLNAPQAEQQANKPGTISLSIAQVTADSNKSRTGVSALIAKLGQRSSPSPVDSTCIPPHEYMARGWDANNNEWRQVLWPALDRQFRAAKFEGTAPVWEIQCPWRNARATMAP